MRKELASGLCPRHIRDGLDTIAKFVAEENIAGAYGPLVNLFELSDPVVRVAVEAVARNQLFNYVVDTEATAALLIRKLQEKGGWLNFVPLDVVKFQSKVLPENADAVPLIKFVNPSQI